VQIFSVVASYDASTFAFVKNPAILEYIEKMLTHAEVYEPFKALHEIYEDLLKSILRIDPFARVSAVTALSHGVFESIRMTELQSQCAI
jgi:hypothetical protein